MASTAAVQDGWMARAALRSAAWAEKWFPDAYVFAVLGVVIVAGRDGLRLDPAGHRQRLR